MIWLFRDRLPRRFGDPGDAPFPPPSWWTVTNALGLAGMALARAALGAAAVRVIVGRIGRKVAHPAPIRSVSWPIFVYVIGMVLVVRGFERRIPDGLETTLPRGAAGLVALGVGGGALGGNLANTVPMTLPTLSFLPRIGLARDLVASASHIGANMGATVTTSDSLAPMLRRTIARAPGVAISTRDSLRIRVVTMPPVLIAATLALWLNRG